MRVGIASCYFNHNYGSMLQAYATQQIIEKMGHEAITIACEKPISYMTQAKIIYYFHKITNKDILKAKFRQIKGVKELNKYPEICTRRAERDNYFEKFYMDFIKLSEPCRTRQELENLAKNFEAVVVGSDMLWHPINIEHDYYTLTFVPDEVKKIAYATSFGTTRIPSYQIDIYKNFLRRFTAISIREKSGLSVIDKLNINVKAEVVLDPTLLFTGQEWMNVYSRVPIIQGKYIFCYFLGVNRVHRNFAMELQKITGYKIVALQHLDEFVKEDIGFGDITPYDIGPGDFINLIYNAEYICTDSFHGSCFSILNHKKFFTFDRFSHGNTQSTNTRIDSLLSLTGLEERRVKMRDLTSEARNIIFEDIDYDAVDQRMDVARRKSIDYLSEALSH